MTHAQSTVPYFTVDAARNVTLVYQGDRVAPRSFFLVNVQPDGSFGSFPTEYRFAVFVGALQVNFVQGETLLRFAYPGNPTQAYRIGGQIRTDTVSAYSHGVVYPISLRVSSVIGGTTYTNRYDTQYLSINEAGSAIARGWTVAGHQRIYVQADGSLLTTDGTGNITYFKKLTATTWNTPAGDFSQMRPRSAPAGFVRAYPDSLKIFFDINGLADSVKDRFGNRTWYQYDVQSRLRYLWDPAMQLITFNYGANGLASLVDASGRTTALAVPATRTLTVMTDPDGIGTRFGYDAAGRLTAVINRTSDTTKLAYDTVSNRLTTITPPAVPIFGAGSQSPVTTLAAWQKLGVPYVLTNVTPFPPVHIDSVRATVTDPLGHITRFTVDRWGQPVSIVDALGLVTRVHYTAAGLPDTVVYPGYGPGDRGVMTHNANGLLLTSRPAGLETTTITYGAWAQPTQVAATGQQTINYVLGTNGRVDTVKAGGIAVQRLTYDARGRVTQVKDGNNAIVQTIQYQPSGYQNSEYFIEAGNRTTRIVRDFYGRPGTIYRPQTGEQVIKYSLVNRVDTVRYNILPDSNQTIYTYNNLYLTRVRDPNGKNYDFTYNALGWVTSQTSPTNRTELFAYNKDGQVVRYTNRRGQTVDFTYDALGRQTSRTGSQVVTWVYDDTARKVLAFGGGAVDTIVRTVWGAPQRAATVIAAQTVTRTYGYTAAGLLQSLTTTSTGAPTYATRTFGYNTSTGVLNTITVGGLTTTLNRNENLQDTSRTFPGGDSARVTFGNLHAPIKLTTTAANYVQAVERWIGQDTLGRINTQLGFQANAGRFYFYDQLGRLIFSQFRTDSNPAAPPPGCPDPNFGVPGGLCSLPGPWIREDSSAYTYDKVGNRTDLGATYLDGNRLTAFDGCTYATDLDGNVTTKTCSGTTTTFVWNAEGQLDSMQVGASTGVKYRYDGFGRLVQKRLNGVSQALFIWEGNHLFAELNGGGSTKTAEYSYYPGMDRLHTLIVGTQQYFAHQDGLGNVIALTDTAKVAKRRYDYTDWGVLMASSKDSLPFNGKDRARWKGALWMGPEVELYFMRNRWMEPRTGRFLSEDPLGIADNINPTVFGASDPVNASDPMGNCAVMLEFFTTNSRTGEETITGHYCLVWDAGGGAGGGGERAPWNDTCLGELGNFLSVAGVEIASLIALAYGGGLVAKGGAFLVSGAGKSILSSMVRSGVWPTVRGVFMSSLSPQAKKLAAAGAADLAIGTGLVGGGSTIIAADYFVSARDGTLAPSSWRDLAPLSGTTKGGREFVRCLSGGSR